LITVMSMFSASPFFSTFSPGMPWQITSLTEMQVAFG
jgi:hypothetical protein